MFGSMKRALAAGAVVATAALAGPAMASAATWSPAGAADVDGQLSMSVGTSVTTCDVDAGTNLTNSPTAGGTVSSFVLNNCFTNVPNCAVSATASLATTWTITVSGPPWRVEIHNVNFTNTYTNAGGTCALNGASINAQGSVEGDFDNSGTGELSFTNEPGLVATGPGLPAGGAPATVNGAVEVINVAGSTPVTLVP